MSFIIGSCEKWFPGFIRREYTRNLQDGHGDYYACFIHGLRVIQGRAGDDAIDVTPVLKGIGGD